MTKLPKSFHFIPPLIIILLLVFSFENTEAQILKKIGQKVERSIDRRVENKINKGVEKGLDKVEDGMDQAAKDAVTSDSKDKSAKDSGKAGVDSKPFEPVSADEAETKGGLVLAGSNCNDYAWFKSGAILEYEFKSADGAKEDNFKSRMEVKSVKQDGDKTIANINHSGVTEEEIELNFVCSGNQLYFDLSGMMKSQMSKMGQSAPNMEFTVDGGMMAIPKNVFPGMKLDDFEFNMTGSGSGINMNLNVITTDRVVEKREQVVTPAGTFDCIKITGTRAAKTKMLGVERAAGKPMIEEMWFAPKVGLVKTVSKTSKGKIDSEQELVFISY